MAGLIPCDNCMLPRAFPRGDAAAMKLGGFPRCVYHQDWMPSLFESKPTGPSRVTRRDRCQHLLSLPLCCALFHALAEG